ncbi:MAG: exonuclease SbcCD subunit D [Spirochaetales bacterium]|nr:exonuclease SbcCD subunit D [Spirochaetales bacterium]
MRIIHTADWHLGKLFYGISLTDDQSAILDELVLLLKDEKPDVLVVSGDIYDRAVPPSEAVSLLDDILYRIVGELDTTVIMIAGNHDNPKRVGFGSKLFVKNNLHITGTMADTVRPVTISDEYGPVRFYPVSYMEPHEAREILADDGIHTHEEAMRAWISRIAAMHPGRDRSVVIAHAFLAGGEESDSERPLSVGGAGSVDVSLFSRFSYAAMGHLHKPQKAGTGHIRYSGSLLKYSFSEADHKKSVSMIEIGRDGECRISEISLPVLHDVRRLTGLFDDLLSTPVSEKGKHDYIMATLLDRGVILDPMKRLKTVYPNLLHIERPVFGPEPVDGRKKIDHRKIDDRDLFASFYSQVTGFSLEDNEAEAFEAAMEKIGNQERNH